MAGRFSNTLLNTGLVVAIVLLATLGWALYSRFSLDRPDARRIDNPGRIAGDIIQIEVMNGCGVEGVAKTVRDHFIEMGFDVLGVSNYSRMDVTETFVVDRAGNVEAARQVARALGIPESRIVQDIKTEYYMDAMVVIGSDYADFAPYNERALELNKPEVSP